MSARFVPAFVPAFVKVSPFGRSLWQGRAWASGAVPDGSRCRCNLAAPAPLGNLGNRSAKSPASPCQGRISAVPNHLCVFGNHTIFWEPIREPCAFLPRCYAGFRVEIVRKPALCREICLSALVMLVPVSFGERSDRLPTGTWMRALMRRCAEENPPGRRPFPGRCVGSPIRQAQ